MLTHAINKYEEKVKPTQQHHSSKEKFTGEYGSEEHKWFIFDRVLANCKWQEGDHCKINGDLGVVCHVCTEFDEAEWGVGNHSLECRLVEVFLYSENDSKLFHPSRLTMR
jgi:hypothetical protein